MYYLMIYISLVLISPYFSALVKAEECRAEEYKTNDPLKPLCCPMCNKGSVVRRDCKEESGTSCIPCGRGTYMNEPNGLTRCFPCSSCSEEPGFVTVQECTSTSNAVCGVLDGYYCKSYDADSMCNLAEKHTKCAPGQGIKAPGNRNTDTECENCQQGYYSLDGLTCTTHTKCPDGQIQREEGNVTKDVVCGDASRNHYALIPPSLLLLTLLALFLVFFLKSVRQEKTHKQPVQEVGDVAKLGDDSNGV